jgi:hypothetical protein
MIPPTACASLPVPAAPGPTAPDIDNQAEDDPTIVLFPEIPTVPTIPTVEMLPPPPHLTPRRFKMVTLGESRLISGLDVWFAVDVGLTGTASRRVDQFTAVTVTLRNKSKKKLPSILLFGGISKPVDSFAATHKNHRVHLVCEARGDQPQHLVYSISLRSIANIQLASAGTISTEKSVLQR